MTLSRVRPKEHKRNQIRLSTGDRAFSIFSHAIVLLFAFLCFYPFWYVFINSIVTGDAAREGVFFFPLPGQFYFGTYEMIFRTGEIFAGMRISAARVLVSTVGCVTFSAMFAFLVSRQQLPFRKIIYRFAIVTMYINAGLIPWYIMMKAYGLTNNFATYVVPAMLNVWFVILIKTFIESAIPPELEESAKVDGARFDIIFFRIILPLCKPILATCVLFNAVGAWNTYLDNWILVTDPRLQTVQMVLFNHIRQTESLAATLRNVALAGGTIAPGMQEALRNNLTVDSVRNATTLVSMIPIMMIYPFLQKYFAKGIMLGAVKG